MKTARKDRSILSNGKELLLQQFKTLQPVFGRDWLTKLRDYDNWYNTPTGMNAWTNRRRGVTGNETLRKIISDMNEVIQNEEAQRKSAKYPAAQRGRKVAQKVREKSKK